MQCDLWEIVRRMPGHKQIVVTLGINNFDGIKMNGTKPNSVAGEKRLKKMIARALKSVGVLNMVQLHNGKGIYYQALIRNGRWFSQPIGGHMHPLPSEGHYDGDLAVYA
jgi:hypothetical protein